jgi:hypothetical protein
MTTLIIKEYDLCKFGYILENYLIYDLLYIIKQYLNEHIIVEYRYQHHYEYVNLTINDYNFRAYVDENIIKPGATYIYYNEKIIFDRFNSHFIDKNFPINFFLINNYYKLLHSNFVRHKSDYQIIEKKNKLLEIHFQNGITRIKNIDEFLESIDNFLYGLKYLGYNIKIDEINNYNDINGP